MQEDAQKSSSLWGFFLVLLGLALLVGGGYYWYSKQETPSDEISTQKVEEVIEEVVLPEEVPSSKDIARKLLAEKHERSEDDVILEITDEIENYAKGTVKFEGDISGAMFLIAHVDEEWQLIFDGNGTVPCEALDEVSYPVELMPECWNDTTMELVIR